MKNSHVALMADLIGDVLEADVAALELAIKQQRSTSDGSLFEEGTEHVHLEMSDCNLIRRAMCTPLSNPAHWMRKDDGQLKVLAQIRLHLARIEDYADNLRVE